MTDSVDILIVGGGFAGTAAALALANGRRRIVVLEAGQGSPPRFAGEFVQPAGTAILDRLGLLDAMIVRGGLVGEGFSVWESVEGPPVLLPYPTTSPESPKGLFLEHGRMVECLREAALRTHGVTLRFGAPVTQVLRDASGAVTGVRLADGSTYGAGLTLVSDGRFSKIRESLGIEVETRLLSHTAVLLVEEASLPAPRSGHVLLGAPGPILAYPLAGDRVRFCFDLPGTDSVEPSRVAQRIREEMLPHVPEPLRTRLRRGLDSGEPFPVLPTHVIRTRRCAGPGFALIGDTAGCTHPLTASGLTTALHDAWVLKEVLEPTGEGMSAERLHPALRKYERRRQAFADARDRLSLALYEVFRGDTEGHRTLREGLFRYWRRSPEARDASMEILAGRRSGTLAFLREFLRVTGHSLRTTLDPARSMPGNSRIRRLREASFLALAEVARSTGPILGRAIRERVLDLPGIPR